MREPILTSTDQRGAAVDRRRGYRQALRAAAVLTPAGEKYPAMLVHVFELSPTGVGFSSAEPFTIDNLYDFEMRDGRQSGSRLQIRSCRPRADAMFDIGGQFC